MRLQNQSQLRGLRSDVRGPVRYFPQNGVDWPPMITTAKFFDGTNDNQLRGANLTGITSGKELTIAFMVKFDATKDGVAQNLIGTNPSNRVFLSKAANNLIQFGGQTSASSNIRSSSATALSVTSADAWTWIGISINTATQTLVLYKNNTVQTFTGTIVADAIIDLEGITNWGWAASAGNAARAAACFCCVALATVFVDLTKTSVRRKFLTADNLPVDITLSLPFGATEPLIWAPNGDLSANDGTGGNFVTTGALTDCADSPNPA